MFRHALAQVAFGFPDIIFVTVPAVYFVDDAGLVQFLCFVLGSDQLAANRVDGFGMSYTCLFKILYVALATVPSL